MSSIAAGVNAERTNRWLLIGALVLAVLAGVLVFALLANFGGDDDKKSSGSTIEGDTTVLVAERTINPGTEVTEDMFKAIQVDADARVPGAITDASQVVGQTTRVKILENGQVAAEQFVGGANDEFDNQLTFKVPDGMRAYSMSIDESTAVGGLLVPGDRVDIIVRYSTKVSSAAQTKQLHIELFADNVEVLARAQTDVEQVAVVDASATPAAATSTDDEGVARRPEEIDPDPGANTVTLALTPAQVLALGQYKILADGEISIALRKFGDAEPFGVGPLIIDILEQ